jgi:outer membrane receptor for ferrienterochelin and colicin
MANMFQEGANFIFGSSFTGYNLADFVSGKMSTFIQGGGLYLDFKGINWSAFVQDDWKATPRFTISAGCRFRSVSKRSAGLAFRRTEPRCRVPRRRNLREL